MSKKFYTDKEGKEFVLKEGFVNKGNEKQKVFVGMEPVINPSGNQVTNPIVNYEFLVNKDLKVDDVADSRYPFLVFGSEFTGAEVHPLPTSFSNNIDAIVASAHSLNALGLAINNKDYPEDVVKTYETASMNNIDTIANALYDQCIYSINQNMIALYNNNLRIILSAYLYDRNDEEKLSIFPIRNDGSISKFILLNSNCGNITYAGMPSSLIKFNFEDQKISARSMEESFLLTLDLMNTIYYNISCAYYELINRISNANIVDFGKLAQDRLGENACDLSYMYSSGIDFVNEIANMECGILSNVVELNVMNMSFQFQSIMEQLGITKIPNKGVK